MRCICNIFKVNFIINVLLLLQSISPGAVKTEILNFPPEVPVLESEDIANAVVYCLQTPPHVQIHELIIKPVGEVC